MNHPRPVGQSVPPSRCFFQDLGTRKVVADFSGGRLSSDGGALLLRQVDAGLGVTRALAGCFVDRHRPELIEHQVPELLAQRLYALALGYEDLNDHAELRRDPLLAAAAGKVDVLGEKRRCPEHRGFALASPSTLNRLELSAEFSDYYRKVHPEPRAVEATLLKWGCVVCPRTRRC
ncbi:MAG: transposase [Chthoniobacter sp.]|uniref:transposase n=1 Tax=Chthoniobacter sp. TaxID=2510640 RepID=UPI0032A1D3F3